MGAPSLRFLQGRERCRRRPEILIFIETGDRQSVPQFFPYVWLEGGTLYFSPIRFFPSIMTHLKIRFIRVW